MSENNRYQNGKIYKLVNNVDDNIYIGSTCKALHQRLYTHKQDAKRCPNQYNYRHLNNIGWENINIILIEKYPCNDKDELLKRERYWVDELKPQLNKQLPTRTMQEYNKYYHEMNKEKLNQRKQNAYHENKEEHAQKHKVWGSQTWFCDVCNKKGILNNKARHLKSKTHIENSTKQIPCC